MFRKMRRFAQQIPDEECREVLQQEKRGVLSVLGDDGYPYGVPIDYLFVEDPAPDVSLRNTTGKSSTGTGSCTDAGQSLPSSRQNSAGSGLRGKIYFHGAKTGHKQDAIQACDKVSFCVMDEGFRKEGEWPLNIRSVIVFGRIRALGPDEQEKALEICRALCHKFTDDEAYIERELQHAGPRVRVLELTIEHMTGKLVNES